MKDSTWAPIETTISSLLTDSQAPLDSLAAGETPAIILRQAWSPEECESLYQRLIDDELLYDPHRPIPDRFLEASIPEGYFREGIQGTEHNVRREQIEFNNRRIDIGTSLGYRGSDPEAFFAHAEETHQLFSRLFADRRNPIDLIYQTLGALAPGKEAVTAHEPDGRRYGPAIIRAHYGGYTYRPHFDSVRLREKRDDYSVVQFDHQFAGVLVLKNTEREGKTAQCVIHRCLWNPEVQPSLDRGTFHDYAREHNIENVEIHLEPGDLYFFNTRSIHEVPGIAGDEPRVVVATFIGYSSDREEIFVWS